MNQSESISGGVAQGVHFLIGIASSAGGLEAISQLLNTLPTDSGATFVIAQHMSPTHKSLMHTLLSRETELPIHEIADAVTPEPNTIYLTPPNTDVVYVDGKLALARPMGQAGTPKPSADRLFASLAKEAGELAIGIVLSGTGSDGSYGVQAIREAGGVTIAQDAASAKYDGMPVSAASTGCIDLVLSPSQIGRHIARILARPKNFDTLQNFEESPSRISDLLQILLARTRVDFRQYKESTIHRRIQRRMGALGIEDYDSYVTHCRQSRTEVDALFKDLLISVTRFLRDPAEFDSLKPVLEELIKSDRPGPLRIWVAGCATGEEAYSIAMLVAEAFGGPERLTRERVQIFATDIDKSALERARLGEYPVSALNDVPEELREKYFHLRDGHVSVRAELKSAILFSLHNVIEDPPFINVDLVSLRNLLIYFNSKLQERVLGRMHHALSNGGYLFLGRSETVGAMEADFEPLGDASHLYRRRAVVRRGRALTDHMGMGTESALPARGLQPYGPERVSVDRELFDTLARALASNAVLVTEQQDIVRVYGDVSPFVELTETSNLNMHLSILRKPFRDEARALCMIGLRQKERKLGQVQPFQGPGFTHVQIECIPLALPESGETYVLVTFHVSSQDMSASRDEDDAEPGDARVKQLQADVTHAREALQQTVEELQTSNEELQAVNEELQATNEELQASNEELETSNEELQSTNEELITVNEELQVNSAELEATRGELETVLDSSPVPIMVINAALLIERASLSAQELFGLPPAYADLHLSECQVPAGFPNIIELASEVLASRTKTQRWFRHAKGHFSMICAPYFAAAGQVRGVNLIVNEIESAAALETKAALSQLEMIQDIADVAYYRLDATSNHLEWSGKVFDIHGLERQSQAPTVEEAIGFYHEDDRDRVSGLVDKAIRKGEAFIFRHRLIRADGEIVKVEGTGRPLLGEDGKTVALVGVFRQLPDEAPLDP